MIERLDGDAYIRACKRLEKSAGWKYSTQQYLLNRLTNISELKKSVDAGAYQPGKGSEFRTVENGHERIITAMKPRDAVFQHALADEIMVPILKKYLIYDSGASLKDKGIAFTRRRFEEHLRWHYRRYSTEGYALMIDFRKYFDNIRHDKALKLISDKIPDKQVIELIRRIFDSYKIDVSYSDDANIENKVFNSLEYQKIPKELKIGERYIRKSIGIGSQISQIIGVFYPTQIDTYCKTIKRIHCYDVYMDDRIAIHPNKEYLKELLFEIEEIADNLGIFINHRKTQIVKLSHGFTWLKTRYIITDSGQIVRKAPRKSVTRERRVVKHMAQLAEDDVITWTDLEKQYMSWRGAKKRYDVYHTLQRIDKLYREVMANGHRKSKSDSDGNPAAEESAECRHI